MQPECISQRASSGRLNCSCSRSRDLTAINPVVPEMMKIAALAVSTAPGGNMSFAFSKSVPIAPAKGRGKRTPAWTNRRAKALVPCGFADAKTAKGILQYQNSRKRLSNCPRIPREEVILSRLVDTFLSRISLTMLPVPNPHNTVCVLSWEEARHWQSRSSGYSSS